MVAISESLQIAISRASVRRAIAFVCLREIDTVRVFFLVSVADDVALVVVTLADEPAEDTGLVRRIGNATF